TCAACHTNDITFQGTRIRVEGAATLADFEGFLAEFANAMDAVLSDEPKFSRFASAVLGAADNGDERARLREQVEEQLYWRRRLEDKNNGNVAAGHGRLDAQSHILNKVALIASPSAPGEAPEDQPTNIRADAPASYPFIWNTDQQGKIQWNGIANNILKISLFGRQTDIGALVRNTSEVIGVFAHVEISRITDFFGYKSSLRLENMVLLERQLGELWSPRWPSETFGALDAAKVARGDEIFDEKCASCHVHLDFDDTTTDKRPDGTSLEQMSPLKEANTDIFLACNTYLHESNVYRFGGRRPFIYLIPGVEDNDKLPRRGLAPTRAMLVNGTVGSIVGDSDELVRSLAKDVFNSNRNLAQVESVTPLEAYLPGVDDTDKKQEAELCLSADGVAILAYKARPLNGIWATAPYLHNGSVPTLYDLLLPSRVRNSTLAHEAPLPEEGAETRPERFMVGGREYDPVKGGFRTDQGPFEFRVRDDAGRPIPGNFNSGHDYGTADLSSDDRWALVEYLKSL
ncbi:MAG TPA: di-heme-cytochrome C peroxidase, partial [Rhizobiaceae bacterium]|nr:di-heme-cytochrome C peroxidase [Rhizobiaceae bacterium]